MYSSETKIRVRYAETDQMQFVYYGNYAIYFEVGRTEALRKLGITYKSMEANGIMLPVVDYSAKFIKPVYYDEELTIITQIKEMPGIRIKFFYDALNEKKELVCKAETTLVFVNMENNRPCRPTKEFIEVMRKFF